VTWLTSPGLNGASLVLLVRTGNQVLDFITKKDEVLDDK
jgi:hypothetical protein